MTTVTGLIGLVTQLSSGESYGDLLRSGPHWLFELTLEALSTPLAFALGWLWRNRLLRHLHRDLQVVTGGVAQPVDPCPGVVASHRHPGGVHVDVRTRRT